MVSRYVDEARNSLAEIESKLAANPKPAEREALLAEKARIQQVIENDTVRHDLIVKAEQIALNKGIETSKGLKEIAGEMEKGNNGKPNSGKAKSAITTMGKITLLVTVAAMLMPKNDVQADDEVERLPYLIEGQNE